MQREVGKAEVFGLRGMGADETGGLTELESAGPGCV